jgi:hypothetical protein
MGMLYNQGCGALDFCLWMVMVDDTRDRFHPDVQGENVLSRF